MPASNYSTHQHLADQPLEINIQLQPWQYPTFGSLNVKFDRLPVFYEFQVGPMLSSPTVLPWFHILLKTIKKEKDMHVVQLQE